ncbi:hypothetical protein MKX01_007022 [Papaver californicum]|nr:hypothetical protein MKX01_007022 [Papaver californicum]
MIPTNTSKYILQAMINMNNAVKQSGFRHVLGASYPPSAATFSNDSMQIMRGIVSFLQNQGFPLFVNVYPYFAYASNPSKIRLDYALFNTTDVVVQDGYLQYKNLFYAMVDSMIWAVEKAGGSNVEIVVSETGWPSDGKAGIASVEHAKMYINNMITTMTKSGTPKRPGRNYEDAYFLYYRDISNVGLLSFTERNFGIYRPDLTEVYHVNWPPTASCDIGNH